MNTIVCFNFSYKNYMYERTYENRRLQLKQSVYCVVQLGKYQTYWYYLLYRTFSFAIVVSGQGKYNKQIILHLAA